jgi:serine/threonine-protein phosphatase Stp1
MSKPHLKWSSADLTHVGTVRQINEDACLAMPDLGLWAVADGMGGHEAGEVASRMIIDSLRQVSIPASWEDFLDMTQACLQEANRQIREKSAHFYNHRVIGSTVVILLVYDDQGACLWLGDSRLYRWREGQLKLISRDHSHVQDLVDRGLIKPEEAHNHPLSNVITRAVGSSMHLDIDRRPFRLQAGDIFLLCSDGLNKVVSDDEIAKVLAQGNNQTAVENLIQLALKRGANDNVTAIVVNISDKNNA